MNKKQHKDDVEYAFRMIEKAVKRYRKKARKEGSIINKKSKDLTYMGNGIYTFSLLPEATKNKILNIEVNNE